jgi:hypothetical protein
VSRTGRYRHITTKIQDKSTTGANNVKSTTPLTKAQDSRERLIEAFLASQSLSMRKIVDFTIDRVTSAVIKDFQVQHMLPIRKEAKNCVEIAAASIDNIEILKRKMREIFEEHLERLHTQWHDDVTLNCRKRIEATFDALLPIETLNDVKKTLINITIEKTSAKLEYWRTTDVSLEIFTKDIHVDAVKLMINNQQVHATSENNGKRTSPNMIIDLSAEHHPSEYFQSMQLLLHHVSRHAETVTSDEILKLLNATGEILCKQTLPPSAYRNIAFYLLQLMMLLSEYFHWK